MRVNTNVSALQANRNLWSTQREASASMAKLSSGFRINRASDDAAGMAIANTLRADTRAMQQASRNAEQANSMLQIMEGAAGSIQKMLERMKELATQAASDNVDSAARNQLNLEFSALVSEIDRTVTTTKFNGVTLLNGSFGTTLDTSTSTSTALHGTSVVNKVELSGAASGTYTISNSAAGTITLTNGTKTQTVTLSSSGRQTVNFSEFGVSVELESSYSNAATNSFNSATNVATGNIVVSAAAATAGSSFLVSASGAYATDGSDRIFINGSDLDIDATTLTVSGKSLTTLANASTALSSIDSAIGIVSSALGRIGASQNRVEYALSNVKTAVQNFAAAESTIRDLDMAEEMTRFTRNQILVQAGTAMLAQANQSSQTVLQLLRG